MGQGSVDEVGEHGFDDGVAAVGDVGLGGGQVGVGHKRVVSPNQEQVTLTNTPGFIAIESGSHHAVGPGLGEPSGLCR